MSALGWAFLGVCFILAGTLLARLLGNLLGRQSSGGFRPLLLAELLYAIVISVVNVITYAGARPYWIGIAITYLPILAAPMVALLGCLSWPRRARAQKEAQAHS
jgi:hypothetical protein